MTNISVRRIKTKQRTSSSDTKRLLWRWGWRGHSCGIGGHSLLVLLSPMLIDSGYLSTIEELLAKSSLHELFHIHAPVTAFPFGFAISIARDIVETSREGKIVSDSVLI